MFAEYTATISVKVEFLFPILAYCQIFKFSTV
jgi:hypothetical protein